ncbi:uncharacterized protein SCHCODRAFT_02636062 [Schizophyllum commune H4-8]|uniref:uncharacterized protein n=1 Tax=Schizophyllum commune (strain H4-8 / FGSC 9210) TaxID=578458 RepID=UPI002160810C|nr:uncharacterized protein SCHCODRAFT_02636062 [Schizophyllum commune H4-8]KAI5888215.1 hypothetical protein SCHCODRAFT_02636062 [Schizophyllum commune H4-8]
MRLPTLSVTGASPPTFALISPAQRVQLRSRDSRNQRNPTSPNHLAAQPPQRCVLIHPITAARRPFYCRCFPTAGLRVAD